MSPTQLVDDISQYNENEDESANFELRISQLERALALPVLQPTGPAPACPAATAPHMAAATDFFHVMTTTGTRLDLLAFFPFEVILVAGLVALLVLVGLGGTVGAEFVET